ncbi:hypothetical protein CALVIDRAFT_541593 [Calocera viscosa TUFC12733]|uniref:Uncharacterized protein n=1 Tax=Calocera viscosa (strain TUFC12733) TaxID=1330018 RepID=A0A167HJ70_CALVF|nr:hypothetical protein CALVIDRAFT_541593 [Calocera viscosa TUFC12733]
MERRDDDVHPVLVRLAFAEDINRAALDLWMNDLQRDRPSTPKFTFEELLPDTHYEHAIDWFADRVQDGTIWTMKGRLLEQVNGEGE